MSSAMLSFIFFCSLVSMQVLSQDISVSGKNDKSLSDKIIGGYATAIEGYPHQVGISFSDEEFCGGFIVSEDYILTAASCIPEDMDVSNVDVRAGSRFLDNGTQIPIAEVTLHPGYDNFGYDKDIAIMKTSDPIQFTDSIQPIDLPPENRTVSGEVTVTGWGVTQRDSVTLSKILKEVELPMVDFSDCSLIYGETLTTNMWCAGDLSSRDIAACPGDFGGAGVQDGLAVGIVSFNGDCGGLYSPTVFTDLAAPEIRNFITNNIGL